MTSSSPRSPSLSSKPSRRSEVGEPVRLELHGHRGNDRARKRPVEIVGVETVDDVTQSNGHAPRYACQQVRDAQRREGITRLSDRRRLQVRIR